ncbi:MAG TPA: amidase [Actinomycetota bacterium]|nr:amidase [Actinomycetota bacterium]
MELAGLSALELASLLASRHLSPVELIDATYARIDKLNPAVNAFAWLRHDAALEDARAAEKRFAGGDARPLEGIPFTAKDLAAIADGPTNEGSRAFEGRRLGVDAGVIARLRAAGAILIGSTTASEFGNRPTTESALFGATRNPWNLERTSGGSSGGAAVAAALGIAPLNHASDGGGSIRIPAACCGVYGIKPARARITLGPLLGEDWGGLDVAGPITRTVADAALFLDETSGPAPGDPYWAAPPLKSFLSAVDERAPSTIAVAYERDGETVDPECIAKVEETAALLRALGHTVTEAQPDLLPLEQPYLVVSTIGIGVLDLTPRQLDLLEPRTRVIFDAAREMKAVEYVRALNDMHLQARTVAAFFEEYDGLLTPTFSRPAPPIGEIGKDIHGAWNDYRNWLCWTWPFNVTGQPAASVPAGFSSEGLPIGVQVVGRAADERTVLSLSAQLERARPWIDHRPPIW